jgi:hypothetical protein
MKRNEKGVKGLASENLKEEGKSVFNVVCRAGWSVRDSTGMTRE